MTETGGTDEAAHSPLKAKSPTNNDIQPMEIDANGPDDSSENENQEGTPSNAPPPPTTPTTNRLSLNSNDCFKTPEPLTPASAGSKKRKRLTPEERNLKEQERQEKRRKLEEEKQKKEQERLEKAKQKEVEKQRKEEEKRRQDEERKLERQKKEEEKRKLEEEKKQERIKKEEEKKRAEEEKLKEKLKKDEEKKKKDEEKRLKTEEKEREQKKLEEKKAKQAQFFTNFFQKSSAPKVQVIEDGNVCTSSTAIFNPPASHDSSNEKSCPAGVTSEGLKNAFNPLPFQIKTDMAIAPLCRRDKLSAKEKEELDVVMTGEEDQVDPDDGSKGDGGKLAAVAPIDVVKSMMKNRKGRKSMKTEVKWKDSDVQIIDDSIEKPKSVSGYVKWRMKLLQFHENRRPAYWGTWKRKPKRVSARKPLIREEEVDYDFDSDDEWEDEPEDAEEIVDSDKDEKDDAEDGGDEEDEEGWMVPHGYLSDSEREGNHADLESMKTKEKEFYKSLSKKSMMEYPFIETTNLACFTMRVCPVFHSAEPVKPVRKRAKPKPKVETTEANVAVTDSVKDEEKMPAPALPPPSSNPAVPPPKSTPKRIRKAADNSKNPYAKPPSGFLAMELPSDDEEDEDWKSLSDASASSGSDSEDEGGTCSDSSSGSDSDDMFIPIITSRPKSKQNEKK